jgi:hypothetical protein
VALPSSIGTDYLRRQMHENDNTWFDEPESPYVNVICFDLSQTQSNRGWRIEDLDQQGFSQSRPRLDL